MEFDNDRVRFETYSMPEGGIRVTIFYKPNPFPLMNYSAMLPTAAVPPLEKIREEEKIVEGGKEMLIYWITNRIARGLIDEDGVYIGDRDAI